MKKLPVFLIIIGVVIVIGAIAILVYQRFQGSDSSVTNTGVPTSSSGGQQGSGNVNSGSENGLSGQSGMGGVLDGDEEAETPSSNSIFPTETYRVPPLPEDPVQRNNQLQDEFRRIIETEFRGRELVIDEVAQVEEYAAVSWSDVNAGGLMILVFTTDGWKVLEVGGGLPLPNDLLQEYGVPIRVGEELLDQTVPDWRLFVE